MAEPGTPVPLATILALLVVLLVFTLRSQRVARQTRAELAAAKEEQSKLARALAHVEAVHAEIKAHMTAEIAQLKVRLTAAEKALHDFD
jgi:hypothetical protein